MSQRLYLSLSSHSGLACPELLDVSNSLWLAHLGVSCSVSLSVSSESRDHIIRISGVVASVLAEK
jgi:hypothetical protein